LSFVVILAVVARGCPLFGSLPNDAELLVGVFNNLLKSLLKVHRYLLRLSVVGMGGRRNAERRAPLVRLLADSVKKVIQSSPAVLSNPPVT
jgi:hypothetical protein